MKLNITFTYQYILFLGLALLLTPTTFIRPCSKLKEVKIERTSQAAVATENVTEILHGEMLFRY